LLQRLQSSPRHDIGGCDNRSGTRVAANTCAVSEAQFDELSMQMNYDAVTKLLGCDGVLVAKEDYGQIIVEHFAWRGAAWPYGRLRLEFINNTLQGTQKH
jgi:hypothetical protein